MKTRGLCLVGLAMSLGLLLACRDKAREQKPAPAGSVQPFAAPLPNKLAPVASATVAPTSASADLGAVLFFDTRLSGDGLMSCATCHEPSKGWTDGLARAKGHDGKTLTRNTPTVIDVDGRAPYFWDGRAATPEAQALGPIESADEMAKDPVLLVRELSEVPEYVARFSAAFGSDEITKDRVGAALAAFERTLISVNSPFDRKLRGVNAALSSEAEAGFQLFVGKAACVKCHDGPDLTDGSFHNLGVPGDDPGRFKIVNVPILRGAFKTPGLRDIALTAPYFHDGSAATLLDVVEHYDKGGVDKTNLDADMKPLHLTQQEKAALVAFMQALTGEVRHVLPPRIPRRVLKAKVHTVKELMRSADGMLDKLDDLLTKIDDGKWADVEAIVLELLNYGEELDALKTAQIAGKQRVQFRALLGHMQLGFQDVLRHAHVKDRAATLASYESVRQRCENCHDVFRTTGKKSQ